MTAWSCAAGQCRMALLATAHVRRVRGEDDCDARNLPAPKQSECTRETFEWMVPPPRCGSPDCTREYPTGDFLVFLPYLELEEGQEVVDRIEAGESAVVVLQDVVGSQDYRERQFTVNFDPSHPPVSDPSALTPEDCHSIPPP